MFLDDKISFLRIGELVEEALHFKDYSGNYTLNDIMNTNLEIREYVKTIA